MTEHFRFMDPVLGENGLPDRSYNAQEFTDYFRALVTTGIMKGAGNELIVTTSGSNMVTTIDAGIAFILGRYYENDSLLSHTHDTESLGRSRIDRIVIRMDLGTEARHVKSFIKKGVASATPVAPTLMQTANVYEISLAQVKVIGGQTFINKVDVVDERGKDVVCPWAGSKILPNFDDTALADLITDVGVLNGKIDLKANRKQPAWINAVLQNGWEVGWPSRMGYYLDEFNVLHVSGFIYKDNASIGPSVILTLPVGFRPSQDVGSVVSNGFNSVMTITFAKTGTVTLNVATAESAVYPFINTSFRLD